MSLVSEISSDKEAYDELARCGGAPRSFAKSMMGGRQRRSTEIGPLTSEARFP